MKDLILADRKSLKIHRTEVICRYAVDELTPGQKIIQFDSGGSEDRKFPGKVSQTLQLDKRRAHQLFEILRREFGFG